MLESSSLSIFLGSATNSMLVGKNTSKNNSENKEKIYFYIDQEHFKLKGRTPLNVKKTSNINLEKEKKREIFLVL